MFYPLQLDLYYSTTTQNDFGELDHVWTYDRSIPCKMSYVNNSAQTVFPDQRMRITEELSVQVTEDIRVDSLGEMHALNDIFITNIRANCGGVVNKETAGPRAGDSTLYEVVGYAPHVDLFNNIDYRSVALLRSDEQVVL